MKPIEFEGCNIQIARDQKQYGTLPAHFDNKNGVVTCCFKLTLAEVESLVEDGEIYLQIMTFGQPLQPVAIHTTNPINNESNKE